jgi:hypothetical protein
MKSDDSEMKDAVHQMPRDFELNRSLRTSVGPSSGRVLMDFEVTQKPGMKLLQDLWVETGPGNRGLLAALGHRYCRHSFRSH